MSEANEQLSTGSGRIDGYQAWRLSPPDSPGVWLWRLRSEDDFTACMFCGETGKVQWIGATEECDPPSNGQWCALNFVLSQSARQPLAWIVPVIETDDLELQTLSALAGVMKRLEDSRDPCEPQDQGTIHRILRWLADRYGLGHPLCRLRRQGGLTGFAD